MKEVRKICTDTAQQGCVSLLPKKQAGRWGPTDRADCPKRSKQAFLDTCMTLTRCRNSYRCSMLHNSHWLLRRIHFLDTLASLVQKLLHESFGRRL